jgi:hypothetical protein
MMSEILRWIDVFGTNFQFTTFKQSKFKTKIGGIISISALITIIVFSFLFGRDFFFKKNPRVLSQLVIPDDYLSPFEMTPENFVIPWRISDDYSRTVNFENIIYPRLTYYQFKKNSTEMKEIDINVTKCSKENAKIPEFSKKFNIEEWYCFDWNQYKNLTFGGYWDASFVNYFQLVLHTCPGGAAFSQNINCTDFDVLKNFMQGETLIYVDFLYPEYYFVPNDLENPLKIYYKNYYYGLVPNILKKDRLFFRKAFLDDDQGWIFNDPVTKSLYGSSSRDYDISFLDPSDYGKPGRSSIIYYMVYYMEKNYDSIQRSYMKFQDLSAVVGGFIKIVMLFAGLFSYIFNNKLRDELIYNEFFELKEVDKKLTFSKEKNIYKKVDFLNPNLNMQDSELKNTGNNLQNFSNPVNQVKISNLNSSNNVLVFGNSLFNNEPVLKEKKNSKLPSFIRKPNLRLENKSNNSSCRNHKVKSFTLKFGICFHIKRHICFFRKLSSAEIQNEKIFKFLSSYFRERMELIHYLKTLEVIDKIKLIIFNNFQNLSFEFLKKPNLFKEEFFEQMSLEQNKKKENIYKDLVNYYGHRIKCKEMDSVDEKLLDMVDPQIRSKSYLYQ